LVPGHAQWSATLGYEDVGAALALTLQPAQGAQFLSADGVNGRLTTLGPADVEAAHTNFLG
jgi:hypothetical protein